MKRIGLAIAVYALLSALSSAQVSLPFPGPGMPASSGAGGSCSGANNEFTDYSNSCNIIYRFTVFP